MKLIVLAVFLLLSMYKLILEYLDYKNRNAPIPDNVKDIYDEETYKKRNEYETESARLSLIEELVHLPLYFIILMLNIHCFLFEYAARFSENVYFRTFFMFGAMTVLFSVIIDSIFGWYDTFVIEEKYGFNKTTLRTFISDSLKHLILMQCLISGGGVALFMYLYFTFGNQVFFIFFFVIAAFIVILVFFNHFFSKLFNKFAPLEEGPLRDKILELAKKTEYPVKRVYIMDGSRRSTRLNAYFTGFGKSKTIVLFDTLVEKMTEDEVTAVLAHEIGHAKHKHTLKGVPFTILVVATLLLIARFVVGQASISNAFGFEELNIAFGLYISLVISTPLLLPATLPLNTLTRKYERDSDAYAAKHANAESLISALKKLARENFSNLTPHPIVVKLTHSHPTISQRVEYLERSGQGLEH